MVLGLRVGQALRPTTLVTTPAAQARLPAKVAPHRATALNRLLAPFFGKIRIDEEDARRLRSAYDKGIVVHVLRASRWMDPLYILHALERLHLAPPTWLHDHFASKQKAGVAELTRTVEAEEPSLLFLKRPRTLINPNSAYAERYVETLLAAQRKTKRPILLLPETLIWTKRAVGLRRTIIDSIFGDRDTPGRMREILGFFWHHRTSRFHVGAPVDLAAVLEREAGQTDRVIAKKIRWAILHHLTREEQIRTGPVHRSAARTRQNVLNDGAVRRFFQEKEKQGQSIATLEKKANDILKTIAADMRYGWLRVLDAFIDVIWSRIYDGIVVDEAGLAAVRSAARRGSVVLVPSHKSHVDYLVLSQVFFKDGMMPPHIAAGENLNFWPVGHIFRRSGAFFIRRSFKGDKLYTVMFAAYVRRLLKEGHAVEFFIEGGRSRTGKLLAPKMGMLSMCVDPVLDGAINDVSFIPVSIGYEKVVEAKSYAKELHGGEKKKEAVTGLLSSTKVLRSRYGRVYVDFAEPISLRVFAAARGYEIGPEGENEEPRRVLVGQLGHRIVYGINEVTRVTPTSVAALVLLAGARRGLAESDLYDGADRAIEFLERRDARISSLLVPGTRRAALREALGRFASENLLLMTPAPDGATIFQVNDAGRLALDYYKNNILHFFVPYAVVSLSVLTYANGGSPIEDVKSRAQRLSHLLKNEFSFRVDRAFGDNFADAVEALVAHRTLVRDEDTLAVTPNGREEAFVLAGLLAGFFEAYRLVTDALLELPGPTPESRFLQLALERGGRQLLEGRIARAEAVSQPLMRTGLALLREDGIAAKSGTLELLDREAGTRLSKELAAYTSTIASAD